MNFFILTDTLSLAILLLKDNYVSFNNKHG